MSMRNRVRRLYRAAGPPACAPEDCRRLTVAALVLDDDPLPDPASLRRCRNCGGIHILREEIVIVDAPARAAEHRNGRAGR